MAYEHNDIATKNRLMSGLGEEIMGFEHNDIVTVDVMEKAIAEGGGGGGGSEDAYIIHFDYETGLLDKTWAEIKNALDTFGQARVVILPSDQEGNVYVVTSCADDGHGEYTITAYWGNSDNSYLTDSEDGYPMLD